MSRTFQRVGRALLAALALAGAAQAQTFHNLYFVGDQPNNLTSVIRTIDDGDDGYIATENLPGGASLVKLHIDGTVDWVVRYGPPTAPLHAEQVRQNYETKEFVWTGHGFNNGQPWEPFIASVAPDGLMVKGSRKLLFSYPAQANDLEIGKNYKDYWIGGTAEPGTQDEAPWIALYHKDNLGGVSLTWAKRFDFSERAQLHSLIPTNDGGAIGVGRVMEPLPVGAAPIFRPRMLAFKVNAVGKIEWAWRYDAPAVEASTSEQWLSDISFSGQNLFVTGTITQLCVNAPPAACAPRPSTIFAASLDASTGAMTKTYVIFPKDGSPVWANTIAGVPTHVGIGGLLRQGTDAQALLLKTRLTDNNGFAFLDGMLYGDGNGPYQSSVEDVARAGAITVEPGFVFVTKQGFEHLQRPAIVRTDQDLSAQQTFHCCEHPVPLTGNRVKIVPKELRHEPRGIEDDKFPLEPQEIEMAPDPCTELPIPGIKN